MFNKIYFDKYLKLADINLKSMLIYRFEFMMSIIISPISLLISFFFWTAIFSNNPQSTILGYSLSEMILYAVTAMVINHAIYNNVGVDLQNKILDGSLTGDLLKPISPFYLFLIKETTGRLLAIVFEVIPVFLIAWLIFRFQIPSIEIFGLFLISLALSFFLNFIINLLMGLIAFWMKNIQSVQWLWFVLIRLFSGEFIPLDFFGKTFLRISSFLPFQYIRYSVIHIFIGKLTFEQSLNVIFTQFAYLLVLFIIFRFGWKKAMKKFGAVGG